MQYIIQKFMTWILEWILKVSSTVTTRRNTLSWVGAFSFRMWYKHCSVQSLSRVQLSVTPWTAACQASLSFIISWSLLRFMSIELVMPSNHLILCSLFTLVLNLPQIRVISSDWFITSGRQSIGPSASVLLINIQSWHFLGLTGLISLLSKGLSRVFSSDTIQKL